jgi:hypothetical protein
VCPGIGRLLGGIVHVGVDPVFQDYDEHGCSRGLRGAKPLPYLVHVALGKLNGDVDVAADSAGSEARPPLEIARVEGFEEN